MRRNGFTLVELLVAMVAGALLLVGLGWAMAGTTQSLRRQGVVDEQARIVDAGVAFARFVEAALMPDAANVPVLEADRLVLTIPPPQALGPVGPTKLELATVARKGRTAVTARVIPEPGQVDRALPETVLFSGLRSARFDYGEVADAARPSLPRTIALVVIDRQGRTSRLVAAPQINGGGACRFDPVSLTCSD